MFRVSVKFVQKQDDPATFNTLPEQFMIQRCDAKSKQKRYNLEQGLGNNTPNPVNITVKRSVNEYFREHDSFEALKQFVDKKFKEHAPIIDLKARYGFKRATTSMLKCAYRFNQHASRDKLINEYPDNTCIRCSCLEDWLHVVKCSEAYEIREKWNKVVTHKIITMAKSEEIKSQALLFFRTIEDFLNEETVIETTQTEIGYKNLFRGFIVKDWFGYNEDETKYHQMNKMIVQQCVKLYVKCWKYRNTLVQEDTKTKERLLK